MFFSNRFNMKLIKIFMSDLFIRELYINDNLGVWVIL